MSGLRARTLSPGPASDVAKEWGERTQHARIRTTPENVYCGRSFREAYSASKELCAELVIISAGLGLIRQHDEIPGYSLTVSNGREDSIKERITDQNRSPKLWWKALASNTSASTSLVDTVKDTDASLVLIALSESYAHMLFDELEGLEEGILRRLRVFGAGPYGLPAIAGCRNYNALRR